MVNGTQVVPKLATAVQMGYRYVTLTHSHGIVVAFLVALRMSDCDPLNFEVNLFNWIGTFSANISNGIVERTMCLQAATDYLNVHGARIHNRMTIKDAIENGFTLIHQTSVAGNERTEPRAQKSLNNTIITPDGESSDNESDNGGGPKKRKNSNASASDSDSDSNDERPDEKRRDDHHSSDER